MAYKNNIPQPSDKLKVSQADLLNNFAAIQTLIGVNHANFGSADAGKHNVVAFPVQSPAPTLAAGDLGLYSFLNPTTTKNELYVHKLTNAGTADIPLTASALSNGSLPVAGGTSWTYLPSGFIMKWGVTTSLAGGLQTYTASQGPSMSEMIACQVNIYNSVSGGDVDAAVRVAGFGTTIANANAFRVYISKRTTTGAYGSSLNLAYICVGY